MAVSDRLGALSADVTIGLADVAMGRAPADVIFWNGTLINVLTCSLQRNINVAVRYGLIAYVGTWKPVADAKTIQIDCTGKYLAPGIIDSHCHIESSMSSPGQFAAAVLPHGTTTICPDCHEIANVLGLRGIELCSQAVKGLPLKVLLAMPVCVPSVPGFEDAGCEGIGPLDVERAYKEGWVQLQGEEMNFPGVIAGDEHPHSILSVTHKLGKIPTGHYPSPDLDQGLAAYTAAGCWCDHESTTAAGILRRIELGMYAQIRNGTAGDDLPECIKAVTENPPFDTRLITVVTDDVDANWVVTHGHLVDAVRKAIRAGVPPVQAFQFATINAAQLLERDDRIGSISPGRTADVLVLTDLANVAIESVFCDGVLVAQNGKLVVDLPPFEYPDWSLHTVHLEKMEASAFRIAAPQGEAGPVSVRVIEFTPGMLLTHESVVEISPVDGELQAQPEADVQKVAVVFRHGRDVEHRLGLGFVRAKMNRNCALATSVGHDCHNITAVGATDAALSQAVNRVIELQGGVVVVVDGRVEAELALPLAGLMTAAPVASVAHKIEEIHHALQKAGQPDRRFELTATFLALPCIPEIHLTNRGLVTLRDGLVQFVPLIVEKSES